jgi:hypothetical protein
VRRTPGALHAPRTNTPRTPPAAAVSSTRQRTHNAACLVRRAAVPCATQAVARGAAVPLPGLPALARPPGLAGRQAARPHDAASRCGLWSLEAVCAVCAVCVVCVCGWCAARAMRHAAARACVMCVLRACVVCKNLRTTTAPAPVAPLPPPPPHTQRPHPTRPPASARGGVRARVCGGSAGRCGERPTRPQRASPQHTNTPRSLRTAVAACCGHTAHAQLQNSHLRAALCLCLHTRHLQPSRSTCCTPTCPPSSSTHTWTRVRGS